jgi:hypothetical protein
MDPLAGIHAAVTRQRADGTPAGGWQRAERVTVEDALRGYTTGPAHAVGEQDVAGRIATGYAADCAVLSHDIVRDPASLLEAQVEMTLAGGEVVYVRKGSRFEEYATSTAGART